MKLKYGHNENNNVSNICKYILFFKKIITYIYIRISIFNTCPKKKANILGEKLEFLFKFEITMPYIAFKLVDISIILVLIIH